jgi:hypothetical protein
VIALAKIRARSRQPEQDWQSHLSD